MAEPRRVQWLAPRVVFGVLAIVVVAVLLLTPREQSSGDRRLTTHSTDASGAAALFEIAKRLGWHPLRMEQPYAEWLDTVPVYAVLYPDVPLTASETHRLLTAVRGGAGLLVVIQRHTPLSDSLHLRVSDGGHTQIPYPRENACADDPGAVFFQWTRIHSWWIESTAPLPADTVTFAEVFGSRAELDSIEQDLDSTRSRRPTKADSAKRGKSSNSDRLTAAVGYPLGRGRVVAVADPDWLRNDVLRNCKWGAGVGAVRMLSYLAPEPGRRIVFDEWHQGFGERKSTSDVIARGLGGTGAGRTTLQLGAAALLLLLALAPRPIAPRERQRIERRSPLEHVGALAGAYEQIGASRVATGRLLRGLRRRRAIVRRGTDADYLDEISRRHPALAGDVRLVLDATTREITPAELVDVGGAMDRIERTMSQ